eukprot:4449679-Pyramimonas_sp.AAC.1
MVHVEEQKQTLTDLDVQRERERVLVEADLKSANDDAKDDLEQKVGLLAKSAPASPTADPTMMPP